MTAPDRTTWTVDSDPTTGEPVLWHGDRAVLRHSDLRRVTWPEYGDRLFDLLTRVLAPDEATIERLARALWEGIAFGAQDDEQAEEHWRFTRLWWIERAEAVYAALADTSAQARHTDDEATGGGEDD